MRFKHIIGKLDKYSLKKKIDYYTSYLEIEKKIANVKQSIIIYSDTPGSVSGGNFQHYNTIANEEWYKEFVSSGHDVMLVADFMKVGWEMRRSLLVP